MANYNGLNPVSFVEANEITFFFLCANHVLIEDIIAVRLLHPEIQLLIVVRVFVDVMFQNNPHTVDLVRAVANKQASSPHEECLSL